jgi:IclR family acetate operon transcriptional repressor
VTLGSRNQTGLGSEVTDNPRRGTVQSVERAFELLECLADAGGEAGLIQLSIATGLPVPTIHRLLRTLVSTGYVRQEESRRYALGPKLIHLGDRAQQLIGRWVRPHLAALVKAIGETANLATLDGNMVVYVAQVPSAHSMRMFTEVGRRVLPHCTGVGKAILAYQPDLAVLELLSHTGMPAQTARTITDPSEFLAALREIRGRGYALDDGEQELGVRCVAVPVLQSSARFGISISGPDSRMTDEVIAAAVPLLQKAAAGLALALDDPGSDSTES